MKEISDPCEYNPDAKRPAFMGEVHAEAEVIVGADGDWQLCRACAARPEFARYRVRKEIK